MKYAIVARYNGANNQETASELGDVVNVMRKRFNKDQSIFRGAIVYEENGEYKLSQ